MNTKIRLTIMNFLEFFVWGSWLISMSGYMYKTLGFTGMQIGSVYGAMGLASLFMPALLGIVADRWVNAERVLGTCHLVGAAMLYWAAQTTSYPTLYTAMLLHLCAFMPTIALNNTVSYDILEQKGFDVVKVFPPIRVWGTIGFIVAMWIVDLQHWGPTRLPLYLGSAAGVVMGIYCFTLPPCRPVKTAGRSLASSMGLDAFVLFRQPRMLVFFTFSMLLGAALQITNTFGSAFLSDFQATHPGTFAVEYPNVLISISQISETLFILAIPFFLRRFGIKQVILMSIFAWVFRFALFGIGNPGSGLIWLILSMIIYGMAFDFFNISGSLFVEQEADVKIRASAQGLFMLLTNGVGAYLGGTLSGKVVDLFTDPKTLAKDWPSIWFSFAGYALILGLIFPFVFRYKHTAESLSKPVAH